MTRTIRRLRARRIGKVWDATGPPRIHPWPHTDFTGSKATEPVAGSDLREPFEDSPCKPQRSSRPEDRKPA